MSDNYQAVYDAVRSRFHCSIDGDVIAQSIASQFFGAPQAFQQAGYDAQHAEQEKARPSVLFRPVLSQDGSAWCALYGVDMMQGVAGFGDSPDAAMRAFDAAWIAKVPTADPAAKAAGGAT